MVRLQGGISVSNIGPLAYVAAGAIAILTAVLASAERDAGRHDPRWPLAPRRRGRTAHARRRVGRQRLQRESEVGRRLEAERRALLETLPDDARERGRNRPAGVGRIDRGLLEQRADGVGGRVAARRPVSISYSTAPRLKMSARWSTVWARTCSGAM
jgi:hypothetical protein